MICPVCLSKGIKPIQESKNDYWLCACGDYHKGFPYVCPRRVKK
jgi:hypothetical protein